MDFIEKIATAGKEISKSGYNSRLSELNYALGYSQLSN